VKSSDRHNSNKIVKKTKKQKKQEEKKEKKEKKACHTIRTLPKSNRKIVDAEETWLL
jgi:hypothetical protein